MHPLSTALFLVGYGLALPVVARFSAVVERRNRLALWGHQAGVVVAALGWILRGRVWMTLIHVLWLVLANAWFTLAPRYRRDARRTTSG